MYLKQNSYEDFGNLLHKGMTEKKNWQKAFKNYCFILFMKGCIKAFKLKIIKD